MVRGQVARMVLISLSGLAALPAPEAFAYPSHRLPDGPRFVKLGLSTPTVLVWEAATQGQSGSFLLFRGSEAGGLRLAARVPALEGSHRYRYEDPEPPAARETVYQLVYGDGEGPGFVLITARVERHALSSQDLATSLARDAQPGCEVSPRLPLPSLVRGGLPRTAQHQSDGWREPPSPPPDGHVT